jgi:hypothetical protein
MTQQKISKLVFQREENKSGILILVASAPPITKIWWPSSNFSGQSKNKLVAKDTR